MKKIKFNCEILVDTISDADDLRNRFIDMLKASGMVVDERFTIIDFTTRGGLTINTSDAIMRYLQSTHLVIPDVIANDPNVRLSVGAMRCWGIIARSADSNFKTCLTTKTLTNYLGVDRSVVLGYIKMFENKGWITKQLVEGLTTKHREITINKSLYE